MSWKKGRGWCHRRRERNEEGFSRCFRGGRGEPGRGGGERRRWRCGWRWAGSEGHRRRCLRGGEPEEARIHEGKGEDERSSP
ncbi:MAG: hypothetical protein GXO17_04175 [Thermodesulfobacteria bacterium]|nr:hypothetical protein [Thermodesulfobacteriota bacterium]